MISKKRCGGERITEIDCPLSCPYNPFHFENGEGFDSVLSRGTKEGMRWIEDCLGKAALGKSLDVMDRRFYPEPDIALIAYENAWSVLSKSRDGIVFPELWDEFSSGSGLALRNDTRIFLQKLVDSEAHLLKVLDTPTDQFYYNCEDVLRPGNFYRYVDFGEQDPLSEGEVMLARFLRHEDCLYVVPGAFIGSRIMGLGVKGAVEEMLAEEGSAAAIKLQDSLPEVWNFCADIQEELSSLEDEIGGSKVEAGMEKPSAQPYLARVELQLPRSVVEDRLGACDLLEKLRKSETEVDFVDQTVYAVKVNPPRVPSGDEFNEEDDDLFADEDGPIDVGTIWVTDEQLTVSALNQVELELLRALVEALVGSPDS